MKLIYMLMDYKTVLQFQLLSKTNIDYLVNTILQNFKISQKALSKCINIITNNLTKYLENLDRYPQNNNELIEAITFLNKKCYDDFTIYLSTKYPNKNLLRTNQTYIGMTNDEQYRPSKPAPIDIKQNIESYDYDNIIILSEEEKNELLKKYNDKPKPTTNVSNDFLSYLTNPMVLQMFSMMIGQVNEQNITNQNTIKNKTMGKQIVIDDILDEEQVKALLAKSTPAKIVNKDKQIQAVLPKPIKKQKFVPLEIDSISDEINTNINDYEDTLSDTELTPLSSPEPLKRDANDTDDEIVESGIVIDLSKKITKDMLPHIDAKVKDLISQKNKYLAENNMKMVKQIDKEKELIRNAVHAYNKELEEISKESESKINGISTSSSRRAEDGDNVEYLDLKFDPTNDYNDLKNIVIKFKSENKITDITLVDYFLPFNSNNVTRFNNKFVVYFNNRITKIIIPPAKYEIQALLDYIKSQITFLDFSINNNKIITIKNTMGKFDLMIDNDTIFPLLGFNGKIDSYKDKLFYSGANAYDMEANEKVIFSLSGSTMVPMEMEFDKEVKINKSLKKTRAGVNIKQMVLQFNNAKDQCYDFILPFKMCFKITYLT